MKCPCCEKELAFVGYDQALVLQDMFNDAEFKLERAKAALAYRVDGKKDEYWERSDYRGENLYEQIDAGSLCCDDVDRMEEIDYLERVLERAQCAMDDLRRYFKLFDFRVKKGEEPFRCRLLSRLYDVSLVGYLESEYIQYSDRHNTAYDDRIRLLGKLYATLAICPVCGGHVHHAVIHAADAPERDKLCKLCKQSAKYQDINLHDDDTVRTWVKEKSVRRINLGEGD